MDYRRRKVVLSGLIFSAIVGLSLLFVSPDNLKAEEYSRPEWTQRGKVVWGGNLHEPLAFYRRENRTMAGIDAGGLWLEDWYDKVRSEETIRDLAEKGANLIYINFAKGAGQDRKFEDLDNTARVVELCHKYGIRLLAYIQVATKHSEEFFSKHPEAENWRRVNPDGKPQTYGSQYYRAALCPANDEYRQYLKTLVRSVVVDYGIDGVFLDNCYYDPCYCPVCQKKFNAYLREHYPDPFESFGITDYKDVVIPEVNSPENSVSDRLQQAWVNWRVTIVPDLADSLRAYMKSLNPDAAFSGNTIYPRHNNWHLRGVNPYRMLHIFDISYCEGHNFPRWGDGLMVSNASSYSMCESAATNMLAGVWLPGTVLPWKSSQVELHLGESMAFGGHVLSSIWALRMKGRRFAESAEQLSDPYFTVPEIGEPMGRYNRFLLDHSSLYEGSHRDVKVALYHSESSMAYDFAESYQAFVNVNQLLLQEHIPFDVLFSQDIARLGSYSALLVCSQSCLSEREIEALKHFVKAGGELIITGESGLKDEFNRERADYPLSDIIGASLFDGDRSLVYEAKHGSGRIVFFPDAPELTAGKSIQSTVEPYLTPEDNRLVESVREAVGSDLSLTIDAPRWVVLSQSVAADGKNITHLLNYDNSSTVDGIRLSLTESSILSGKTPRIFSPDGEEYNKLQKISNTVWVVEKIKTYTVICWE